MARSSKPAGDLTGRMVERQAKANAEELAKRQNEIATAQRIEDEQLENTIVDYSDPDHPRMIPANDAVDGIVELEIDNDGEVTAAEYVQINDPNLKMVQVRVIEDCEFSKGYGNNYEFKAGQRALVPKHVADHLDEKGLIV